MRSFIVGTAGHIDHGKSSLVHALTGTDPDRLKEEKERGITIDLGFAHAALSQDAVASFVDVPGHERFVRTMLAGAHGIDAVLLVVACDESVMPQTREHFDICRLLGLTRGVVALTKSDAADAEMCAVAEADVREMTKSSFLQGAPLVRVSAKTGAGIETLKAELLSLCFATPPRRSHGLLRLPIDRSFALKGFGTVVTGTLVAGSVRVGDEIEVLPRGHRARVRGLQVHGTSATLVEAGHRCAVNLTGAAVSDLARGDVITSPATLAPTRLIDVSLSLLPKAKALKHGARVHVHSGSAASLGRVRFANAELKGGEKTVAVIRLETPLVLTRGDALVLRSYSPVDTIGGALVLNPHATLKKRSQIPALSAIDGVEAPQAVARFLADAGASGLTERSLASQLGVTRDELTATMRALTQVVELPGDERRFVDGNAVTELSSAALRAIQEFHAKNPLAKAMPREALRQTVFSGAPPALLDFVVGLHVKDGHIRVEGESISLKTHRVELSGEDEETRRRIEAALQAAGLAGIDLRELHTKTGRDQKSCERVVRVLTQAKDAERIGDGLLVIQDALAKFRSSVIARFPSGSAIDVGAIKEMTGLTRKHVIPLLEWLDRAHVTRRVGDARVAL